MEENQEVTDMVQDETGIASVPSGLETPDVIDLRKESRKEDKPEKDKQLFQVIPQAEASVGAAIMGSAHQYIIPSDKSKEPKGKDRVDLMRSQKSDKVEISLNPTDIENLSQGLLERKYEEQVHASKLEKQHQRDEVDEVIEENARKKQRKAKADDKKSKKKQKESSFTF